MKSFLRLPLVSVRCQEKSMRLNTSLRILVIGASIFICNALSAVTFEITVMTAESSEAARQRCIEDLLDLAGRSPQWRKWESKFDRLFKRLRPDMQYRSLNHRFECSENEENGSLKIDHHEDDRIVVEISYLEASGCAISAERSKEEFIELLRKYYKEIIFERNDRIIDERERERQKYASSRGSIGIAPILIR